MRYQRGGQEPGPHAGGVEQQEQRHANRQSRNDQREQQHSHQHHLPAEPITEGKCRQTSDRGGQHGGGQPQDHAVLEGHKKGLVFGESPIPTQRESAPRQRDGGAVVEGQQHEHGDRGVEKGINGKAVGAQQPLGTGTGHARAPNTASSRVMRLAATSRSRTTLIIISASTAPNGQLNVPLYWSAKTLPNMIPEVPPI